MTTSLAIHARRATAEKLSDAAELARLASSEPDPEVAIDLWDAVMDLAAASGEASAPAGCAWAAARGDVLASLRRWRDAADAYASAAAALSKGKGADGLKTAMAYDGESLALGALGDWTGATDASRRALAAAGLAGVASSAADVPTTAPCAGLRGGAPTVAQRLDFNAAMARWGAGDVAAAAAALRRLDKGPEPDAGYPQFWEARAALTAALWASNAKPAAEAEWVSFCRPVKANPPATPSNGVRAAVNRAAQMQFDGYGALMDKRCEDFTSGTPLPCNDAGIPGSAGSSAPCAIFTPEEARSRLWPPEAVDALAEFLKEGPEYVLRASEMAR